MHVSSVGTHGPSRAARFRELFDRHAPYVWRCARRLGLSAADAEDLCQEVFVVVHRKLERGDGEVPGRAWLYGTCLRKVWDHRRLSRHKRERITDEPPEQAVEADPATALDARMGRRLLDGWLAELDDDKRAVFVLYEIEQLGMKEIAEAVSCPLQTAYSRLHAARKQVQAAAARERARRARS